MTLALAGIFRDSIVLGADTLTTFINPATTKNYDESSHKIEEYKGRFAFIFAGLKYIPDLDSEDGTSINVLIRTLERELSTDDPQKVFSTLTTDLSGRFKTFFTKNEIKNRFELAMLGYLDRRPFYWFYDYNRSKRGEIDVFMTVHKPYGIICCGTIDSYEPANLGSNYYRHVDTGNGLKLIKKLLNEAYQRELASTHPPFINERFDFAVLSPSGFYWNKRQKFPECHRLSEAVNRIKNGNLGI